VYGAVDPATADQRVLIDVTAPGGRIATTLAALTAADGRVRSDVDLTAVVKEHGPGTYTVQAFIFDADELDDASSNTAQLTI
jgi:hypothetical protein